MENNPIHYDGRGPIINDNAPTETKPFEITDEMRKNISGNPYEMK